MRTKGSPRLGKEPRGYNIVELLILVSVVGIMFAIGIPAILGGIQRTGVDGAARRLADDIRLTQSSALMQGVQARLIAFDQSGVAAKGATAAADNCSSSTTDTSKANMYRIETRSSAAADWPPLTADPTGNSNVLTTWERLGTDYRGVSITSGGNTICFNSQGFLAYSASPLSITAEGPGGTKTVQTSIIGKATIQ